MSVEFDEERIITTSSPEPVRRASLSDWLIAHRFARDSGQATQVLLGAIVVCVVAATLLFLASQPSEGLTKKQMQEIIKNQQR